MDPMAGNALAPGRPAWGQRSLGARAHLGLHLSQVLPIHSHKSRWTHTLLSWEARGPTPPGVSPSQQSVPTAEAVMRWSPLPMAVSRCLRGSG